MLQRLRFGGLGGLIWVLLLGVTPGCSSHGAFEKCIHYRPSHCTSTGPCRFELEIHPDETARVWRSGVEFDAGWTRGPARSGHAPLTVHIPELSESWDYLLTLKDMTLTTEDDWVFDPGPC